MSNNVVWLSQYSDCNFVKIYDMQASLPNIVDAVSYYDLEIKHQFKHLTDKEEELFFEIIERIVALKKKWFAGELIDKSNMPTKIYVRPPVELPRLEDIAFVIRDAYLVMNQTCYDIISQHNLGKTHFSQVYIYDIETQQQLLDTPYYFINIAETREFFDMENSKGVNANPYMPELPYRSIFCPNDLDIILDKKSANCKLDLWHDPKLEDSLFLSDKLVQALLKSGITKENLGLVSCQLV